jgi:hypothetical protein
VVEQRPVLNAIRPLPVDLGVELFSNLLSGELTSGVDQRRDLGIAPQFDYKGQILDLPRSHHKALGPEFFCSRHDHGVLIEPGDFRKLAAFGATLSSTR